jgi:hypothetical protein
MFPGESLLSMEVGLVGVCGDCSSTSSRFSGAEELDISLDEVLRAFEIASDLFIVLFIVSDGEL